MSNKPLGQPIIGKHLTLQSLVDEINEKLVDTSSLLPQPSLPGQILVAGSDLQYEVSSKLGVSSGLKATQISQKNFTSLETVSIQISESKTTSVKLRLGATRGFNYKTLNAISLTVNGGLDSYSNSDLKSISTITYGTIYGFGNLYIIDSSLTNTGEDYFYGLYAIKDNIMLSDFWIFPTTVSPTEANPITVSITANSYEQDSANIYDRKLYSINKTYNDNYVFPINYTSVDTPFVLGRSYISSYIYEGTTHSVSMDFIYDSTNQLLKLTSGNDVSQPPYYYYFEDTDGLKGFIVNPSSVDITTEADGRLSWTPKITGTAYNETYPELNYKLNNLIDGQGLTSIQQVNASALGTNSVALNNGVAIGENSFAQGKGTVALGDNQHVTGKYNVSDDSSLQIVGKGISDSERSNAYKLDQNGNAWFAGNVKVGDTDPQDDDELVTKYYVDSHTSGLPAAEEDGSGYIYHDSKWNNQAGYGYSTKLTAEVTLVNKNVKFLIVGDNPLTPTNTKEFYGETPDLANYVMSEKLGTQLKVSFNSIETPVTIKETASGVRYLGNYNLITADSTLETENFVYVPNDKTNNRFDYWRVNSSIYSSLSEIPLKITIYSKTVFHTGASNLFINSSDNLSHNYISTSNTLCDAKLGGQERGKCTSGVITGLLQKLETAGVTVASGYTTENGYYSYLSDGDFTYLKSKSPERMIFQCTEQSSPFTMFKKSITGGTVYISTVNTDDLQTLGVNVEVPAVIYVVDYIEKDADENVVIEMSNTLLILPMSAEYASTPVNSYFKFVYWGAEKITTDMLPQQGSDGNLIKTVPDSTVLGKYNLIDSNKSYAFIVGNGTDDDDTKRHNAMTLDWGGNAVFSGGLTVTTANGYQEVLSAGNIKTINGNTLIGTGNIVVGNGGLTTQSGILTGTGDGTVKGVTSSTAGSVVAYDGDSYRMQPGYPYLSKPCTVYNLGSAGSPGTISFPTGSSESTASYTDSIPYDVDAFEYIITWDGVTYTEVPKEITVQEDTATYKYTCLGNLSLQFTTVTTSTEPPFLYILNREEV